MSQLFDCETGTTGFHRMPARQASTASTVVTMLTVVRTLQRSCGSQHPATGLTCTW